MTTSQAKKLFSLCLLCTTIGLITGCASQGGIDSSINSNQIASVSRHDVHQSVLIGRTTDMGVLMNYGYPSHYEQAVSGEKRYIYRFSSANSSETDAVPQLKQISFSFSKKNILTDLDYFDSNRKKSDEIGYGKNTPVSGDREIVNKLNALKTGMSAKTVRKLLGQPFIGTAKTFAYNFQKQNDPTNPISLSAGFSRNGRLSYIALDRDYAELIKSHTNLKVPIQSVTNTKTADNPYVLNKDEDFAIGCFENNRKESNARSIDLAKECLQKIAMTSSNAPRRITGSTITQDDIDRSVRKFSETVETAFQLRDQVKELRGQVKSLKQSHTATNYLNVYKGASALVDTVGGSNAKSDTDLDDFSDIDDEDLIDIAD